MNVMDAAFNVAEDYPGGARALAVAIDKNPVTFSHEVKGTGGAKLGLATAVKMTKRTSDARILTAFAAECGFLVLPLPEALDLDNDDCARALAALSREFGQLCNEACLSLSDGKVSDTEMHRLEREGGELMQSLQGVLACFRARNQLAKPPSLGE
jgi:hypothetical protein